MLNNILESLSWFNISWFSHRRIQTPLHILIPCYCSAILAVLFNSSVEFSFAFDKIPEFNSSSFNLGDRMTQSGEDGLIPKLFDREYTFKFGEDFISEFDSFFGKFISLCSIQNKAMDSNDSKKSNDNTDGPWNIFGKNVVQKFPILIDYIFIVIILPHSTQH